MKLITTITLAVILAAVVLAQTTNEVRVTTAGFAYRVGNKLCVSPVEAAASYFEYPQSNAIIGWVIQDGFDTNDYANGAYPNQGSESNMLQSIAARRPTVTNVASVNRVWFDGVDDYMESPVPTWQVTGSAVTVSCWVKSAQNSFPLVTCFASSSYNYRLLVHSTGPPRFFATGLSDTVVVGTTSVDDNAWHHVAGVYDGTNLYIYVDGSLDDSDPSTGSLSNNASMRAFVQENAVGSHEQCFIGDAMVWSTNLTATQVNDVYTNQLSVGSY